MVDNDEGRPSVAFVVRYVNHYREPFYRQLRDSLAARGIAFHLIHGDPSVNESTKNDSVTPEWADHAANRVLGLGGREIVWQPKHRLVRMADLVIVEQASRLVLNYRLALDRAIGRGPKLALIGHGVNLASTPSRIGEAFKGRITRTADWFFAYTEGTRDVLRGIGFPENRITIFQNTIDTAALRDDLASVSADDIDSLRADLGVASGMLVLTLGSLYPDKRPELAVETVARLRDSGVPAHLILVGSGELDRRIDDLARQFSWLHHRSAAYGREKAEVLAASDALLIPGVGGLVVIDGLVSGLPMILATNDHHPPEVAYVRNGRQGLIVDRPDPELLAAALHRLWESDELAGSLRVEAERAGSELTIEAMVERFTSGIVAALGSDARKDG